MLTRQHHLGPVVTMPADNVLRRPVVRMDAALKAAPKFVELVKVAFDPKIFVLAQRERFLLRVSHRSF